jgi:hypothetical protein
VPSSQTAAGIVSNVCHIPSTTALYSVAKAGTIASFRAALAVE